MTYLRMTVTIAIAAAINWGLLGLMQYLIATGEDALSDDPQFTFVPFVHVKRDETVQPKREPPAKFEKPQKAPDTPPPRNSDTNTEVIYTTGRPAPGDTKPKFNPNRFGHADGDYLPIVKVEPIYPRRALERELEGWVLLEFTVTRLGTVADIVVLDADPPGIFNKAAVSAAAKFKYKPKVVDGDSIDTAGVLHRISFRLNDK